MSAPLSLVLFQAAHILSCIVVMLAAVMVLIMAPVADWFFRVALGLMALLCGGLAASSIFL